MKMMGALRHPHLLTVMFSEVLSGYFQSVRFIDDSGQACVGVSSVFKDAVPFVDGVLGNIDRRSVFVS